MHLGDSVCISRVCVCQIFVFFLEEIESKSKQDSCVTVAGCSQKFTQIICMLVIIHNLQRMSEEMGYDLLLLAQGLGLLISHIWWEAWPLCVCYFSKYTYLVSGSRSWSNRMYMPSFQTQQRQQQTAETLELKTVISRKSDKSERAIGIKRYRLLRF